jgi:hypothetical protein
MKYCVSGEVEYSSNGDSWTVSMGSYPISARSEAEAESQFEYIARLRHPGATFVKIVSIYIVSMEVGKHDESWV